MRSGKFTSEREWCRRAGVADSYIGALRSRHDAGTSRGVRLEQVAKLAAAAGVSVDWLMGNEPATPPTRSGLIVVQDVRAAAFDELLERFRWSGEVDPELVRKAVAQLRREYLEGSDLPQAYWHARLERLLHAS